MGKTKKIVIVSLSIIVLGTILSFTGFLMGGRGELVKDISGYKVFDPANKEVVDKETEAFKSIDIDSNANSIEVIKSNRYAIEMEYQKDRDDISYSIENGKLLIKETKKKNIDILSKISIGKTEMSKYIKIYVPSDAILDSTNIKSSFADISMNDINSNKTFVNCDYGNINVENINSDTFNINTENGNIKINNLKCSNESKIKNEYGNVDIKNSEFKTLNNEISNGKLNIENTNISNAMINNEYGDIKLDNVKTNGLKIDGENSDIELNGEFSGNSDIKCEYGDVKINNNTDEALYNYNFSCEYGNIKINGKSFEKNVRNNANHPNNLDINSENGDIEVNFK